jgi:hypothetical protein
MNGCLRIKNNFYVIVIENDFTPIFGGFEFILSLINIRVDVLPDNIYASETIEVFTPVPPDPVSAMFCRHWVVLLTDATGPADSAMPAGKSNPQSYTS